MPYCPPKPAPAYPAIEKAVGAQLNYGFDLAPQVAQQTNPFAPPSPVLVPWLAPGEEVIELSVTSDGGTPTGTTDLLIDYTQITANAFGVPGSLITAWISGGTVGTVYVVTFTWGTNSSPVQRIDSRSIQITVVGAR
jgi:hypothetical protein